MTKMTPDEAGDLLFQAARTDKVADAQAALDAGADVNARRTGSGNSPLHEAAWRGNVEAANLLLAKGADVNAKNVMQETPLHLTVWRDHPAIAGLLIERGADINAKNNEQYTPLHLAVRFGKNDIVKLMKDAAKRQQCHTARIAEERKDQGPPQIGG